MKKVFIPLLIVIIAVSLFASCGQLAREVAKSNLNGQYYGKATYVYRYSSLNIGIDDIQKSEKCGAIVFADAKSPSVTVMSLPDMVAMDISITGFKLHTNGTSFNIPEQVIKDKNLRLNIRGNPTVTDAEGNKMDGFIDDNQNLTLCYSGILPMNENGVGSNLPFEAYYEMKKVSKKQ